MNVGTITSWLSALDLLPHSLVGPTKLGRDGKLFLDNFLTIKWRFCKTFSNTLVGIF